MLQNQHRLQRGIFARPALLATFPALAVLAFSLVYFTDVCIRASEKYFWFDELCTLYIARLPNLHQSWQAVLHGADYNPPLFYIIMRAAHKFLGEGLIAFRIPAILGFWILCLCLFGVVYRRAGIFPAFIAMTLPVLSGAYYYAYEARPHALVLGFCGLSILFWQLASDRFPAFRAAGRRGAVWLIGFSLTLLATALTHCYGILLCFPFACAEIVRTFRFRKLRWTFWIALITPALLGLLCLVPLVRTYRNVVAGTGFGDTYFRADFGQLAPFYIDLLAPCTLFLLFASILFALKSIGGFPERPEDPRDKLRVILEDIVLALGLLAFPILGIVAAKAGGGPFVPRYFLSALPGICLLLGWWTASYSRTNRIAPILCIVIAGLLCKHTMGDGLRRARGVEQSLIEPSTGLELNTVPGNPLKTHSLLVRNSGGTLPIAIDNGLIFLYLNEYAPELGSRLYLVASSTKSLHYRLLNALRVWCHIQVNGARTFDEFAASNKDFLIYGPHWSVWEVSRLMELGAKIKLLQFGSGHFIAEVAIGQNGLRSSFAKQ